MSEKLQESLSALMDDEADEFELRRLLKALAEDADTDTHDYSELQATWSRYHLIRDTLHSHSSLRASTSLLAGIQSAIAEEELPTRVAANGTGGAFSRYSRAFLRAAGQGSIAASVALVVLFTAHSIHQPRDAEPAMIAGQSPDSLQNSSVQLSAQSTGGQYVENEFNRTVSFPTERRLDEQTRQRLQQAIYREFEEYLSQQPQVPVYPEAVQD